MENEKRYLDGHPKTIVYGEQREAHKELGTLEKAIAQYSEKYSRDIHNNQGCELLGAMQSIDLALGHLSLDCDNAGYSLVKNLHIMIAYLFPNMRWHCRLHDSRKGNIKFHIAFKLNCKNTKKYNTN